MNSLFVYTIFNLVCHLKLKKKKLTIKCEVKIDFYGFMLGGLRRGSFIPIGQPHYWDVCLKIS